MKKQIAILAILFLTFSVWAPTLSTYFSQDDWVFLSHVYKQPFLSVFKHYSEAFYRPVGQQLFFFLGSNLFGLESQGFHLIGLAIHLFNIWLLSKLLNIWNCPSTRTPRGWLRGVKYFLLTFYAVNPAHFVALNWLTQIDLEIAVSFALLAILFWKRTIFSFGFFLAALLSHETVVMLPIAMLVWISKGQSLPARPAGGRTQGLSLIKPAVFFSLGVLISVAKFLANPFSLQSDYSLNFNLPGLLATLKWYVLRALMIPEGIRNFPAWLMILSLIPGIILILMFRQKLVRGLGIYLLGVLPVLGFGGHLLSAYAVFGIALMVIELGKKSVIPARFAGASARRAKAGIYLNRFRVPPSLAVRLQELFVHGSRSAIRRAGKPGMTMLLATVAVWLTAVGFVYSNHLNHWSTQRGVISRQLTQEYIGVDSNEKSEILTGSKDFEDNPEIYFSTMIGKQFEVLDRRISRGIFGWLFYRGNDLTTQFLPDAEFFKTSILAGKFPMWNPWIFAGMPYFLDPQNFLWYPPNYIFLLVPVEAGFLLLLIGHLALAGWGVKRVLGEFGVFGKFALLGVGMFVLAPKLMGHIEEGNWTLVIAACWLPILYLAMKKNKFWWTAISLSAIIINNLNIGYYSVIFVTLFYLLSYLSQKRTVLAEARTVLKILIFTAVLTIPRWLPLVIFGGQTVRADLQEAPLPVWSWTKIAKSLAFPLAAGHPALQNEEILYLGIIPILVILLGILGKLGPPSLKLWRVKRLGKFWIVWLCFVFLVALNNKTPLFHLIKWLPGFSLMRITTRPWIFASLAAAVAVPLAIRKIGPHTNLTSALGLPAFVCHSPSGSIPPAAPRRSFGGRGRTRLMALFSAGRRPSSRRAMVRGSDVPADFLAKIRARPKNWGLLVESILVLLILSEFIWFDWKIFDRREIVFDPVPARFYRQMAGEGNLVRAYCTTGCLDRLTAQKMGIALLGGNNPIQLKSFVQYLQAAGGYRESAYHPILPPYTVFNQQPQPKAELLSKTTTQFVVSPYRLTDQNFELIDASEDFFLYLNVIPSQPWELNYFDVKR